jgi:hypothetical protein
MKTCVSCGIEKSLEDFYKESRVKDGRQARCKKCHIKITENYRKKNPELYRKASKKHWHKLNDKKKHSLWIKRYGITLEDYQKMHDNQKGVCKICKKPCKTKQVLSVDHCHKTNKVRGLLCVKCNTGLGMFNDNVKYLQEAINYLSHSEELILQTKQL